MYQPAQPPQASKNGLTVLGYDSGVKFVFKELSHSAQAQANSSSLAKVIVTKPE